MLLFSQIVCSSYPCEMRKELNHKSVYICPTQNVTILEDEGLCKPGQNICVMGRDKTLRGCDLMKSCDMTQTKNVVLFWVLFASKLTGDLFLS